MGSDDLLSRPAPAVVAIDGPAGAGKSAASRRLAAALGFDFLDTGAMYRAVALAASRAGVSLADADRLATVAAGLRLRMDGTAVFLDGDDVSEAIRTPEMSQGASVVAACPAVRVHLVRMQREIAAGKRVVSEGRDVGTVVFPDAPCKFFLTADLDSRVGRRADQMRARGETVDVAALRAQQIERDHRDSTRADSPLRPAEDAVIVDSSGMSLDEVVAFMIAEVRSRVG